MAILGLEICRWQWNILGWGEGGQRFHFFSQAFAWDKKCFELRKLKICIHFLCYKDKKCFQGSTYFTLGKMEPLTKKWSSFVKDWQNFKNQQSSNHVNVANCKIFLNTETKAKHRETSRVALSFLLPSR